MPCWIADADGRIFWYNTRWLAYTGTRMSEVVGDGWHRVHKPDYLPTVVAKFAAGLASGEAFEMRCPLRGSDGVFRRFTTRVVPLRNASGEIARWLGTNTDVEGEAAAQEALAASEAKFEALNNAMPQMLWTNSPDGEVDYFNQRWYDFAGVDRSDATPSEIWLDMIHPDDRESVIKVWRKALKAGKHYSDEYRLRHSSGVYRWVLGHASPEKNADGEIVRWIGSCTDIDEQKRTAQHTELLSRELSHRIKNIFAVIGGLVGLSAYRDPAAKAFAKSLSARIAALARAHNFARPHSDISRPADGTTSLHGLLRALLGPYDQGDTISYGGIDLTIDERSATPLALVFHELATNAAKYGALSTPEGRITIEISERDECICVDWIETGGPPVTAPSTHKGFGTELSEISIEDQLGGVIERDWRPEGLHVCVKVRRERLNDQ